MYADIIVDISHNNIDRTFTYNIPKDLENKVYIGSCVDIAFGGSVRKGYILSFKDTSEYDENKIKDIIGISNKSLSINDKLIKLALHIKNDYGCTMSKALKTVMPVKNKIRVALDRKINLKINEDDFDDIILLLKKERKTSWIRLLSYLRNERSADYNFAVKELKISSITLKRMEERAYINIGSKEVKNNIIGFIDRENTDIILNDEQRKILEDFSKDFNRLEFNTYLLHGITGSGKTQVYINLIEEVIKKGKQVIFLIPEISLTYQTVNRLISKFGNRVAIINSKLSGGEKYEQFEKARNSSVDIMVGPRSAIFAPFNNLGLIIIDEEHDGAYKNETIPRYDTREIAKKRAMTENVSIVLGSATPSIESYMLAKAGKYKFFRITKRAVENSNLPNIHIVDLRQELRSGNRNIFSRKLQDLINNKLDKKEQIMLFMNRRGYSNFISCRSCGYVVKCEHCDVSMKAHNDNMLHCHYCNNIKAIPQICPSCKSPYIAGFGVGTQKLEVLTQKIFPRARILRLDTDTAAKKNSSTDILKRFKNYEADILIGTQMIVKGHDFEKVSLVGIMAADASLYIGEYKAAENTFQLLTQASGRSGRGNIEGDVLIQTYNPSHYAIEAVLKNDYESFYRQELAYRKIMNYPPIVHILMIQFASRYEDILEEFIHRYKQAIDDFKADIVGPANAGVYKVQDFYRKILYIKHMDYDILLKIKEQAQQSLKDDELIKKISIMYDFT